MKKILFPTDFSHTSLNALVYAINLARTIDAEIVTLHVYNLPEGTINEYYNNILENYDISEWGNFENFKSEVPKLRAIAEKHHASDLKISHLLERGLVVDTILEVCERDNIDYVVMGTDGADGIVEATVGSVTEKVMNGADQMVFAIPGGCHFIPISKILFLSQLEDRDAASLNKLKSFAEIFNAHIDVVHVKEACTVEDDKTLAVWRKRFPSNDIAFHIVEGDKPEETIVKYTGLHFISLIAISVKKKGLFSRLFYYSLASSLAFHSTIPVLSIKRSYN